MLRRARRIKGVHINLFSVCNNAVVVLYQSLKEQKKFDFPLIDTGRKSVCSVIDVFFTKVQSACNCFNSSPSHPGQFTCAWVDLLSSTCQCLWCEWYELKRIITKNVELFASANGNRLSLVDFEWRIPSFAFHCRNFEGRFTLVCKERGQVSINKYLFVLHSYLTFSIFCS